MGWVKNSGSNLIAKRATHHGTPGLGPLLPDQSAPNIPRAVDTISAARPTSVPCSLGLLGGVRESLADGASVGDCGFSASTDAGAGVGGAGTATDMWRSTDGECEFEARRTCLSSPTAIGARLGFTDVGFGTIE